jgi:hypothetical protein
MQDAVYDAMENVIKSVGRPVELVQAICIKDEVGWYAKITIMETLTPKDVVVTHR